MVTLSAEAVAATILGFFSVIDEFVPVLPLSWRLGFILLFLLVVADLCLRSRFIKRHLPAPYQRVMLSVCILLLISTQLWNPPGKQYAHGQLPLSFARVTGRRTNDAMMIFSWRHYGPALGYDLDTDFKDQDLGAITNERLIQHRGIDPANHQMAARDHRFFNQNAIDASTGKFEEELWLATNSPGASLEAPRLKQLRMYAISSQKEKTILEWSELDLPFHWGDSYSHSSGSSITNHFASLRERPLPFLPSGNIDDARMLVAVLVFAFLMYLPVYYIFAHWWIEWTERL